LRNWPEALVCATGLVLLATPDLFPLADDEIAILTAALKPLGEIVALFASGGGQHEHPPLSDILLSGTLGLTDGRLAWARVPSTVAFAGALVVVVRSARLLGGQPAAAWTAVVAGLSPYGFHFGRMAGWYGFAALLVAVVTHLWLRVRREPTAWNWVALSVASLLLAYTNYFGWAVVGLLVLEALVVNARCRLVPWWWFAVTPPLLLLVYVPVVPAFTSVLRHNAEVPRGFLPAAANTLFSAFVSFASEAVAPWNLALGPAAVLAVGGIAVAVTLQARWDASSAWWKWLVALALMGASGVIIAKRVVMVMPWLWLGWGVAAAAMTGRLRQVHAVSCVVLLAVAWAGVAWRGGYSAMRFVEPWPALAREAVDASRGGTTVVTNGQVLLFYLKVYVEADPVPRVVPWTEGYGWRGLPIHDTTRWLSRTDAPVGDVLLLRGQSEPGPQADMDRVQASLDQTCALVAQERLLRDSGYAFKRRLFPRAHQVEWRLERRRYACPAS
jgi:hypothetical protein